ncbi:MAG TPA: DUF4384 domain-containing protein, partial [Gemmatimonadales bacterium]|nr:DUF4384 domain-containing protein [Gemmatimonadales bacterium]
MIAGALFSLLAAAAVADSGATPVVAVDDPPIQIWLNNDRRFQRGDRARVEVRARDDGYLLLLHVDPDGRLRVLLPLDPGDDNFVRGGKRYEVEGRGGRESFTVEESSGTGVVFAAVSPDPFRFDEFVRGDHWDYRVLAPSRLSSDPEPELVELVRRMAPGGFDYDVVSYEVYSSVAHTTYHVHRDYVYHDWYDPWYDDPWYRRCFGCYGSSVTISLHLGRPYRRVYVYDPFFYDPFFYDPFYYRPIYRVYYVDRFPRYHYYPRYYHHRPRFHDSPRFRDKFGQDDAPYRERYVFKTAAARNTVYAPSPRRLAPQTVAERPLIRRAFDEGEDGARYAPRGRRGTPEYRPGDDGRNGAPGGMEPRRRDPEARGPAILPRSRDGGATQAEAEPRDHDRPVPERRERPRGLDQSGEPERPRELDRPREYERPRAHEPPRESQRPREYERPRETDRPRA